MRIKTFCDRRRAWRWPQRFRAASPTALHVDRRLRRHDRCRLSACRPSRSPRCRSNSAGQIVRLDTTGKARHDHRRYRHEKHLYFVLPEGKAMRYGIGVGREGFEWHGTARIALKREWPVWTPPAAMIRRKPELAKWRGGMPPGPQNALGARAMYLFNKGGDSGYRLHGTPEWCSIGKAMSSGCIRLHEPGHHRSLRPRRSRRQGHRQIAGPSRQQGRPA